MGRPATLKVEVVGDARGANSALESTSSKLGKLGKMAAVGAGVAAAAVGALAVSSIRAASDVQQAFGAVDSIFGKTAGQVKKLANSAATDVGLAASEYADLANVLGSQLKNMGTSADKLVPSTDKLIKQGADLAATFGGSTADAVSAVSSLLKGERDPIERYGVSIKAADVSARLAAQGLGNLTGKARQTAEAQATLAMLTEQTAAAHGSFARESDTVAGVQQRLSATVENLKAKLGAGLLPVLAATGEFLLTKVLPAASALGAELRARLGPAFAQVGAFISQRVVPAARSFLAWYVDKIVPGIRRYVTPIIEGLRKAFGSVSDSLDKNGPKVEKIRKHLQTLAEFTAKYVLPLIGKTLGKAFETLGVSISLGITLFTGIYDIIDKVVRKIGDLIDKLKDNAIVNGIGKVAGLVSSNPAPITADQLAAARNPGQVTAAGGVAGTAGWGNLTVTPGTVTVLLDGEPLRAMVRNEVRTWERTTARRLIGRPA